MKKIVLLFSLLWFQQKLFAQTNESVGINTYTPDPSAALDVQATNKGVLLPRVFLQTMADKLTIPNPEKGLLLFNTNPGLAKGAGFYFNAGSDANPFWQNVDSDLTLPYSQTYGSSKPLFVVSNNATTVSATAIWGYSDYGQAMKGFSTIGTGIWGFSNDIGTGVVASSLTGLAMQVDGRIKISGANVDPENGRVLTALDAVGNAHWATPINEFDNIFNGFHSSGVLQGGNQNMSESAFVKIAFAKQNYDIGTNYNDANMAPHSSFIAPKHGIYHFDVMTRWEKADTEVFFGPTLKLVRIRGGVTTELSENRARATNGSHTSHIAIDCELQQGDVINVIARAYAPQVALSVEDRDANFTGHLAIEL
ncbi:hypothetical protein [Dyadobacter sp. CY347]|uniref:hypothetical protein n=1 Tax=Dyadobacter sp. CY347 TaxID=2909336 RepID=UPI001F37D620|nr:hypothetical protein [Dyadobacter sp. CY347]MCF2488629.1 hypothetical protein [Dyadobacter sp. CY347]